jgi:hypothetical protein
MGMMLMVAVMEKRKTIMVMAVTDINSACDL